MSYARKVARAATRRNHRSKVRNLRALRGRVYVASPIQTYATPRYDAMLARLRQLLPQAEVLPARDLFTSNEDWRQRWPVLLPTLDALVFFDHRGSIGRGVYQEIEDAAAAGLTVFYLPHPAAELLPYDGEHVRILPHGRSWERYAEVLYLLTPEMLRALGAPEHAVEEFRALQNEQGGV